MIDLLAVASVLDQATRSVAATRQVTATTTMTVEEAYGVQHAATTLRVERGDVVVGLKLGFTSQAKALQMGVPDVVAGVITHQMRVQDGGTLDHSRFIHPRIEPEVAFRLGAAIDPNDPRDEPQTAVYDVAPALEIIDSRYEDFSFTLNDVVADNCSAASFVIGPWRSIKEFRTEADLANLGVVLEVDGTIVETGSTAAILGHPLRALEAAKRMARQYGFKLPAGSIILAGAATAAVPLPATAGTVVVATITGLGRASVLVGGTDD